MNAGLLSKMGDVLNQSDKVVYVALRDPIAILPNAISAFLWTLILGLFALAGWDVGFGLERWFPSTGIVTRFCVIAILFVFLRFVLGPFINWRNEILCFVTNKEGKVRGWYRKGYWKNKKIPIKLSSLIATPIRQDRAFYQKPLGLADIKFDVIGEDDDVFWKDTRDAFLIYKIAEGETGTRNPVFPAYN